MLCSVVKHLGSGRAPKKWGKTFDFDSCFPYTSFVLYKRFLRALQLNKAQSRLIYLLIKTSSIYLFDVVNGFMEMNFYLLKNTKNCVYLHGKRMVGFYS